MRILLLTLLLTLTFSATAQAAPIKSYHLHLLWSGVTSAERGRQLDLLKAGGATMARVDVGWASLEYAGKGQYDPYWTAQLDDVVAQAKARGIKLLLTFWRTPPWASASHDPLAPPTKPGDYGDAIAHYALRYGTDVYAWEIWNEPNSTDFFHPPSGVTTYTAYMNLLKSGYSAAKFAGAQRVVAGSTMHSDFQWLAECYKLGLKSYSDIISTHPYSDNRSPLDRTAEQRYSFVKGIEATHFVMSSQGDGTKPLWLTEYGWSTKANTGGEPTWRLGVSEDTQAQYIRESLQVLPSYPYVGAASLYRLMDDTQSDVLQAKFGVVRLDGSLKPGYGAFRDG